jgi:hypothetical protein
MLLCGTEIQQSFKPYLYTKLLIFSDASVFDMDSFFLKSIQRMGNVQPLWKTVWRFLTKLNTHLPYDPAIQSLGIYPNELGTCPDACTWMFIEALFINGKTWKQKVNG